MHETNAVNMNSLYTTVLTLWCLTNERNTVADKEGKAALIEQSIKGPWWLLEMSRFLAVQNSSR